MTSIKHTLMVDFDGSVYDMDEDLKLHKLVTQRKAADLLNVTIARIGQLMNESKLKFICLEGFKLVYLESVTDRLLQSKNLDKYKKKTLE